MFYLCAAIPQCFYAKSMFWKKSPADKLKKQYETLMKEAFDLSKVDRKKADAKTAEAEAVMKQLEKLQAKG